MGVMIAIAAIVTRGGPEGRHGMNKFSPTREVCDVDESLRNL